MEIEPNTTTENITQQHSLLQAELANGDWEAVYKSAGDWLQAEPDQPVAIFIQNITCLFINPPAIIRNKRYLDGVKDKDWKAVLAWFSGFYTEQYRHNPYYQAINFILQPTSKKKVSIETALQENPNNAELLFLQSISLRDHRISIEKLKLAIENKPDFPAAVYLMGIFSLELNQVEAAKSFLEQAISLSPEFLEAHYQLGSLYSLYMPDASEQARTHLEKVIELDPEGGAGRDAKKVLENHTQPQYGQRIGGGSGVRRGMSIFTILGITLLAVWLFSGPIASLFHLSPMVGVVAGLFVFIGLYMKQNRSR